MPGVRVLCFAYLDARIYQAYANWRFDRLPALARPATFTRPPALRVLAAEGSPLSRMAIPRLDFSVMVSEGIQPHTLARAAGHIPGTAFPDELGNVGIAGHRDTFFRKLSEIRRDDLITLTTPVASYRYSVEWTRVVAPDDVAVLNPSRSAVLTLVTCYPFHLRGPRAQEIHRACAPDGVSAKRPAAPRDQKVHADVRRMQQRIVNQASANSVQQALLLRLGEGVGTLELNMDLVQPRRAQNLGCGSHATPSAGSCERLK